MRVPRHGDVDSTQMRPVADREGGWTLAGGKSAPAGTAPGKCSQQNHAWQGRWETQRSFLHRASLRERRRPAAMANAPRQAAHQFASVILPALPVAVARGRRGRFEREMRLASGEAICSNAAYQSPSYALTVSSGPPNGKPRALASGGDPCSAGAGSGTGETSRRLTRGTRRRGMV